jgi:hypothetical protein
MKKNILIVVLLLSNVIFGITAYQQKVSADNQRQIADTCRVEAEHQRILATRAMQEAQFQRILAEEQMKLAAESQKLASELHSKVK